MRITINYVASKEDLEKCIEIRRTVFVEEQGIPEEIEMDDYKSETINFLALINEKHVGTARYKHTQYGVKLERFSVLSPYRNLGVGKSLVEFIINSIDNKGSNIYLHAQDQVINFYSHLGFEVIGEKFYEADIQHQKMIYVGKVRL